MKKIVISWMLVLFSGMLFSQVRTDTSTNRRDTMRTDNDMRTDSTWQRNNADSTWRNRNDMNRNDSNWRNRDRGDSTWRNRDRGDSTWRNRDRGDSVWRNNRERMRRENMDTAGNKMRRKMRQTKDTMVMGSENQWNNSSAGSSSWNGGESWSGQQSVEAALPVLINYVPEDVVSALKGDFGDDLYSITCLKLDENNDAYSVVTLKDGTASYNIVDKDGGQLVYPPAPTEMDNNMNNGQDMNGNRGNNNNNGQEMNHMQQKPDSSATEPASTSTQKNREQ